MKELDGLIRILFISGKIITLVYDLTREGFTPRGIPKRSFMIPSRRTLAEHEEER